MTEPPDLDAALVRRLLAAQFPHWSHLPVTPIEPQGWDNATFRVGSDISVRLPRYERWEGQVEREQRWLPWLAPQLPLTVPEPLARGEPGEGYPFPWSVYRWLDGERATPERLDPLRAAADLAAFFTALRGIDASGGPPPEWSNGFRGVGVGDPRDSAIVEWRVREKIVALEGLADTDALTAVWDAGLAAPAWQRAPVWVHGDPAPGNLLSVDGRISAVIDFGTLAVGDPACDLIAAWTWFDREHRELLRSLLEVDEATWERGRVWGLVATLPTREELTGSNPAAARQRVDELIADLG